MKTHQIILAIAAFVLTAACSKSGFQTAALGTSNISSQEGGGGPFDPALPQPVLKSSIDGGMFDTAEVLDLDLIKRELLLKIPVLFGFSINLPQSTVTQLQGIYVTNEVSAAGDMLIVVHIPLKHVLQGVTSVAPGKLPNGNPLPLFPSGELPRIALNLDQNRNLKWYIYVGVHAAAVYVETDWSSCGNLPICPGFTFPIKNQGTGQIMGAFSIVAPVSTFRGGFYLAAKLPADMARLIENWIQR